jgi:5-formyltetrahydrofolate cyclo-ligase
VGEQQIQMGQQKQIRGNKEIRRIIFSELPKHVCIYMKMDVKSKTKKNR